MSDEGRIQDARIPPVGAVAQAERMFRINWISAELRSPSGVPMLSPDFVAALGRGARVVDVRTPDELTGALGYIPGSDWVPLEGAEEVLAALPKDEPLVLVSRGGERAGAVAQHLEAQGHRFVTALMGGVVAWRQVGLSTSRDASLLSRANTLAPLRPTWEAARRQLTREDIEHHVGDPRALRWMKVAALLVSGRLCCVDGRAEAGVVGTPGGDAGELLLAVAALESLSGKRFDDDAMRTLLLCRLDAFGRLYLHTDIHASNETILAMRGDRRLDAALERVFEPLEWRRFLRSPPAAVRPFVLEHMTVAGHLGCGHLRLSMQRGDDYGVRPELVRSFLRAFLTLRWEGVDDHEVGVLPGGHAEGAVVNVLVEGGAEAYAQIPLVSPMAGGSQMFLQHPQVAGFLRGQLARFIARSRQSGLRESAEHELLARMNELGARQLGHTLGALAAGLPVYDVTFDDDDAVRVEARGHVPG
jgi:rhodanese-related sulfurtransferase